MKIARVLTAAAFATAFAVTTASAQAPQGVPVIGQIQGVDGQNIMVKYKDGEKKIIIGSDAVIRRYVAGDKSELKPGAHVGINATKQPDGSLQTARVNVGRGDVIPD